MPLLRVIEATRHAHWRAIRKETALKKKPAKKKESFFEKIDRRIHDLGELGGILVRRPRDFPGALLAFLKRLFRNVWDVRGGGLYTIGYLVVLIWLEITMLIDDVVNFTLDGYGIVGSLLQYVFRFSIESLANAIKAFIWPVYVIELYPPWGILALGAMFVIFPAVLKKPLEKWLFDGK